MNPYLHSEDSESETSSVLREQRRRSVWVDYITDCLCILLVLILTGFVCFILYAILTVL